MIRRRQTLGLMAAPLVAATPHAATRSLAFRSLPTPEPIAQLSAGGPTGLLAVGVSGKLWALPLRGSSARLLGDELDAATPLATGHGRIAGRRRDGALWVLEGGRIGSSAERSLAPAAGLLVLPLAVIAIVAVAQAQHVVRLEGSGSGGWHSVARSAMPVLPDAQPLQADLDGSGDGGHVVVLAGPDRDRYRHAVLGDDVEATRLVLLERHGLQPMRELVLGTPHVFEDIAPRKVSLGSRDGLLTVRSGPHGAQLVLIDADPTVSGALRIAASGPALGTVNRWLSPITDGQRWLAVHTPHIGGVLHEYRRDDDRLQSRQVLTGVSNHRIGSRLLDQSAWRGRHLLMPDQSGRRVLMLDALGWQVAAELPLESPVVSIVSLGAAAPVAVLQADGAVVVSLEGS